MKKIAEVQWIDSRVCILQEPLDENFEPCLITSIGYVHINDKKKIVLYGDAIDDDGRRITVIPKECIKRLTIYASRYD